MFIHRSELHSIACGSGAGSSSRFADLVITLDEDEDKSLEFNNIDKEEVEGINNYINNTLVKAMARDVKGDEHQSDELRNDTKEEIDNKPNHKLTRKRKSQRSASLHSRKATKIQMQSSSLDTDSDEDIDYAESESESDEDLTQSQDEGSDEGSDTESDCE